MENSPMTVKQALKVLKETGEYLNRYVGTDSYNQRCKLYDAAKVLEASKMPSKGKARKQAGKMCINKDQGEGFGMCFGWLNSLAKPSKKP